MCCLFSKNQDQAGKVEILPLSWGAYTLTWYGGADPEAGGPQVRHAWVMHIYGTISQDSGWKPTSVSVPKKHCPPFSTHAPTSNFIFLLALQVLKLYKPFLLYINVFILFFHHYPKALIQHPYRKTNQQNQNLGAGEIAGLLNLFQRTGVFPSSHSDSSLLHCFACCLVTPAPGWPIPSPDSAGACTHAHISMCGLTHIHISQK